MLTFIVTEWFFPKLTHSFKGEKEAFTNIYKIKKAAAADWMRILAFQMQIRFPLMLTKMLGGKTIEWNSKSVCKTKVVFKLDPLVRQNEMPFKSLWLKLYISSTFW